MFKVTKNGKELDRNAYHILDISTKTFSTNEDWLTIECDDGWTLRTGSHCTFKTGSGCTFDTGSGCTFDAGSYCTFKTGSYCTFKTGSYCTFSTGSYCTFNTGDSCVILYWNAERSKIERYLPEFGLYKVERGSIYEVKEEPKKEMTVAEIEKALGYSIKIVK